MNTCEQCGEPYGPRPREGKWLFEKRRFCSKRCAGLAGNPRTPDGEFKARYRKVKTPDGRNLMEHRYVMEQMIGRPLRSDEQVHHKNHDRLDNRPENLELVSSAEHGLRHTVHPITKVCENCGVTYTPQKTKRVRSKSCSRECGIALSQRNRRAS